MASNQDTALLALQTARDAIAGLLQVSGQVLGNVLTFDGTSWVGEPASGGVPGTFRQLASGSVTLLDNIQTTIVQVGPLAAGERLWATGPTPLDFTFSRTVINESTALVPLNNHTHWAAQSNIGTPGFYNYQARQQDGGGASVSYIWGPLYGVIP